MFLGTFRIASRCFSTAALCWLAAGCGGLEKRSDALARNESEPKPARSADAVPIQRKEAPELAARNTESAKLQSNDADLKSRSGDKQLESVGQRLAAAGEAHGLKFSFDSLQNPRPRTHHSENGQIYITTGMLEELKTPDELAAVLALEMAQCLAERRVAESAGPPPAMPSVGPTDAFQNVALQSKIQKNAVQSDEVRATAQAILDQAGFNKANAAAARDRLHRLAAKPETPAPRDSKLRQVFAN